MQGLSSWFDSKLPHKLKFRYMEKKSKSAIGEYANAHPILTFILGISVLSSIAVIVNTINLPKLEDSNEKA